MKLPDPFQTLRLAAAVCTLSLAACSNDPAPQPVASISFSGPVVARINQAEIKEPLLMAFLRMRGQVSADQAAREAALVDLSNWYLLAQHAEANGIVDKETRQAELEVRRIMQIAELALADHRTSNPVTDEDLRAAYEIELSRTGSTEYRLRHMLSPEEEGAQALMTELANGVSFDELEARQAEAYGISAAGELGWVHLGQVPPTFGPAIADLEPGQYTPTPVASEYGWHIVLVEEKRPHEPPSFEQVREGIRAQLDRQKVDALLGNLKTTGDVELFPR